MLIFFCIIGTLLASIILFNLKSPGKRIEHNIKPKGKLNSETIMRSIGQLLGPPLVSGNKIIPLLNGDEIFPAMLKAIRSAESTITFETFIYWSGEVGKSFSEALSDRARKGVQVNVLLDWIGSQKFDEASFLQMKDAGVRIERYRPLRWYNLTRVNNRTHRKILVIDGKIGFTGGVGIADQWQGNAQDKFHWRDSHFQVHGPVVAQLQAAFLDNWNATHSEVLHGNEYFPELTACGDSLAQVFKSSPEEGSGSVRLMYLYAIAHAEHTIRIANAYFVPDTHIRQCLIEAASKGVKIEVVLPGKNIDTDITRRASRAVWGDLLAAGVKIYEYGHTMLHCKYMIVDNIWLSVGSTNMDNRSFRLNDECNLNITDEHLANSMSSVFEADKSFSREITLKMWQQRPLTDKVFEWTASLFRSQV